jgi:fructuronate reductase
LTLPALDAALLGQIPEQFAPPRYGRAGTPAVVHIGCGAFHRAHQAAYFDELLRQGESDWLIQGVSLRSDTASRQLNPQDGLYSLVERDGDDCKVRVIGSLVGVMSPVGDPAKLVRLLANPATQLVTLTITEKGYCVDPVSGALQLDNPEIAADIRNPAAPRTAPGFIVAGLAARKAAGVPPFTVLSCDNLSANGGKARSAVVGLAAQTDAALAAWIEREVAFPSSMVDRITPATTPEAIAQLAEITGYRDAAMIETEPFHQWIVEDWFSGRRPPLDRAGVQMTDDVAAWEAIKLRLLNGAHSSLAYLGGLLGYRYVHEAIADPDLAHFVAALWDEIVPTLPDVEGFDPVRYRTSLLARFSNAALDHQLSQIAIDGSQKLPQRLIRPLSERLAAGQPSPAIELAVACWIRWQAGSDFAGRPHHVDDARAELYTGIVRRGDGDCEKIVRDVFGTGLFGEAGAEAGGLVVRLSHALQALCGANPADHCRRLMKDPSRGRA